jgi:hypothetical protein
MDYDTTNANLADVMRGETLAVHGGRGHYCSVCKGDYPCGPAFCGTDVSAAYCLKPKDWICGGCYMRMLYD